MLLKTHAILVLFVSSMLYSCASTSVSDDQAKGATVGTTVKTSAYRDLSVSKWVHAKSGLVMRDAPSKTAKRIELIPPYIKVRCVKELITEETIEGVIGAWTFVEWERVQGWVFGGFLSTKKPAVILHISKILFLDRS